MYFWDNIINTAMMGTGRKQVSKEDLPEALREMLSLIEENQSKDDEERFLQLATLAFNYRQSGIVPVHKEAAIPLSPAEEKKYCSDAAMQVLKDIIHEESRSLLELWLQQCDKSEQVVKPELVPWLLQTSTQQKKLRSLISSCCGKRGEWLGSLNPEWNFPGSQADEELWLTGTPEQRRENLIRTRKNDPAKAMEWLRSTWPQEDANTKTALLESLEGNTGTDDLPFLESLETEKSKKVKDAALHLLKRIPGSSVLQQYEKVLGESVVLKREKVLLGMVSKVVLQFSLPQSINDSVYKSGIDKLSNTKDFTDDEYILFQLSQSVPPSTWERQLDLNAQQIIELFQKDTTGKKLLPALVNSIVSFGDTKWAQSFVQYSEIFYIDLLPLLPQAQREAFSNQYFDKYPDAITQQVIDSELEWSMEMARNIIRYTAKKPQYSRSFYEQNIRYIPVQVTSELQSFKPPDQYLASMWDKTSEYISSLVRLKNQTIKAFNP